MKKFVLIIFSLVVIIFGLLGSKCYGSPTTQEWLQATIDTAPFQIEKLSAQFKDGQVLSVLKTIIPVLPATKPVILLPKITRFTQAINVFKFQQNSGDFIIRNIVVNQGGLIRSTAGNRCELYDCYPETGADGLAVYQALVATGPGRRFVWNNSNSDSKWIPSGFEAALRLMGGTISGDITQCDFVCRRHDSKDGGAAGATNPKIIRLAPMPTIDSEGYIVQPKDVNGIHWVDWKQPCQIRDIESCTFTGSLPKSKKNHGWGRTIGELDGGKQANPMTKQFVKNLTVINWGMTHEIHVTDWKSVGTIIRKNCYKIDDTGRALYDSNGNLIMWPDYVKKGG